MRRSGYDLVVTGCVNLGGFSSRGLPSKASANSIGKVFDIVDQEALFENCDSGWDGQTPGDNAFVQNTKELQASQNSTITEEIATQQIFGDRIGL